MSATDGKETAHRIDSLPMREVRLEGLNSCGVASCTLRETLFLDLGFARRTAGPGRAAFRTRTLSCPIRWRKGDARKSRARLPKVDAYFSFL
jgi:hypothetical protein